MMILICIGIFLFARCKWAILTHYGTINEASLRNRKGKYGVYRMWNPSSFHIDAIFEQILCDSLVFIVDWQKWPFYSHLHSCRLACLPSPPPVSLLEHLVISWRSAWYPCVFSETRHPRVFFKKVMLGSEKLTCSFTVSPIDSVASSFPASSSFF